jgi:outer membrane murein-binding lipoprotein Lpp
VSAELPPLTPTTPEERVELSTTPYLDSRTRCLISRVLAERDALAEQADLLHRHGCARAMAALHTERGELAAKVDQLERERDVARADHARLVVERADANRKRGELADGVERLRASLRRIADWSVTFGADLKPHGSDTYGEGMRTAKYRVSEILRALDAKVLRALDAKGTPA